MNEERVVRYAVEFWPGCYAAPWSGDPGRTLLLSNANLWRQKESAERYLERERAACRQYSHRDLAKAKVIEIEVSYALR